MTTPADAQAAAERFAVVSAERKSSPCRRSGDRDNRPGVSTHDGAVNTHAFEQPF